MDTIRCAIYIRVSTDEQAKEGYSLSAQEERLRALAKSQGWQIYQTYTDDGYSAKDLNRPGLKSLLFDAKLKRFDVLLIYKIDRLSRKLKDLIEFVLLLNSYEIGVKSSSETIDTTTPAGRLIFHQFGSFAQYERELIGERTKFGMMKRLKLGYWNTIPPYGYRLVKKKLVIDKKESEVVRKIFDLHSHKNMGVINIAKELLSQGIKPRCSPKGLWKGASIYSILKNPIYIGRVRWGGEEAEGLHKAIIDPKLFKFVQERLSQHRTWTKRYQSPNHFLGVVSCGLCKSPMHIQYPGNEKKRKYKYYACSSRLSYGTCKQDYVRADILERSIIEELKGLSVHKEEIETLANEYRKGNRKRLEEMASRRAKLDTELAEIDTEKEKLYQWLMKNKPTDDGRAYLENKTSEISRKDGEIKKELMLLDDRMTDIRTLSVSGEIVTKNLTDFVKIYDGLEPGEKKLLIESVVRLVEVKEGMNIRISLQVPLEKFRVFIPQCVPTEN